MRARRMPGVERLDDRERAGTDPRSSRPPVHPSFRPCVLVLTLLAHGAACGSATIDTSPASALLDAGDVEPEPIVLPPSYVSAPVFFDLRPLLRELETAIPRRVGSVEKERRVQVGGRVWVAPELRRGALHFTFAENSVTVATEFEYRARAWVRPLLVEIPISCGMGEVRPRLRVKLATTYDLTAEWRLRTRTRLVTLEPVTEEERDQCEVSVLRVDVTDRVVSAAQEALRTALRRLDRDAARLDLRGAMSDLWEKLQEPISIADGRLWFEIRPQVVSLGPVVSADTGLTAQLDLLAMPRMRSGSRPPGDSLPLPDLLRTGTAVDTAMVLIEGVLSYDAATRLLGERLNGRRVGVLWRRVRIDNVILMPAGAGRVLLAVRLSGGARGVVYAVGTPRYDAATDRVTVPDLTFDVNTEGALEGVAGWLLNGPLLEDLRERAQLPASELLSDAVELANREVNRELTEGVWLRGNLSEARTLAVIAVRRGLVAQARGSGSLRLDIAREHLLPKDLVPR